MELSRAFKNKFKLSSSKKKSKTRSKNGGSSRKTINTNEILAQTGIVDASLLRDLYFTDRNSTKEDINMHKLNLETLNKK